MSEKTLNPSWGYHPDGRSEVFPLVGDETLPLGWYDHPDKAAAKARPDAEDETPARRKRTPAAE